MGVPFLRGYLCFGRFEGKPKRSQQFGGSSKNRHTQMNPCQWPRLYKSSCYPACLKKSCTDCPWYRCTSQLLHIAVCSSRSGAMSSLSKIPAYLALFHAGCDVASSDQGNTSSLSPILAESRCSFCEVICPDESGEAYSVGWAPGGYFLSRISRHTLACARRLADAAFRSSCLVLNFIRWVLYC